MHVCVCACIRVTPSAFRIVMQSSGHTVVSHILKTACLKTIIPHDLHPNHMEGTLIQPGDALLLYEGSRRANRSLTIYCRDLSHRLGPPRACIIISPLVDLLCRLAKPTQGSPQILPTFHYMTQSGGLPCIGLASQ